MARPVVALLMTLLACTRAGAMIRIDLTAESQVAATVSLRLIAGNGGGEAARDLLPTVTAFGEEQSAPLRPTLDPGGTQIWELAFPAPPEPGAFPMIIRVRYADPNGNQLSALLVHTDRTPDTPKPGARATLSLVRVAGEGEARLAIENPAGQPLPGRVVLVAPAEFSVEPDTRDVTVPASGRAEASFRLTNLRAPVGSTYPLYAWFDYREGSHRQLALGTSSIEVEAPPQSALPRTIGAVASGAALFFVGWLLGRRWPGRTASRT